MLSSVTACESRRCCRGGLCHARRDVKVRPGPVGKLQQPFHNNFAEYQFQTQATGSSPLSISLPSPLEFPKSSAFYATTPSQQAPVNWLRVSHPEPSRLARPEVTRPASAVTPIRPTARPPHLLRRRQPVPTAVKTLAPGCLGRASYPPSERTESGELGPRLRPTVRTSALLSKNRADPVFPRTHTYGRIVLRRGSKTTSRCWAGKSSPETKPQGTSRVFD